MRISNVSRVGVTIELEMCLGKMGFQEVEKFVNLEVRVIHRAEEEEIV